MNSSPRTMKCCAKLLTLAVLSVTTLSGCATIRATAMRTSGACVAFSPITFSAKGDTRATIAQLRGHNAAWDAICEEQNDRR
ncbi:hypothetical protein BMS3Bbin10_02935 [bacterium BMS3Bbin10]|nr:hypothetical protein BMS3Bbin10_02935 [bacterium BMS3Bbin10]